MRVIV